MAAKTNHVAQALINLPIPMWAKPYIWTIVRAVATEIQALEDAAEAVKVSFLLDSATGVQLKLLGEVVGQPSSLGLDDPGYRQLIKARIQTNNSNGIRDQILKISAIFTDAGTTSLEEIGPAHIQLSVDNASVVNLDVFRIIMRDAKARGVLMTIMLTDADGLFWSDANNLPTPAIDAGWGDAQDLTGYPEWLYVEDL